ncbi:oxidoreductase [Microlunatus endophyticus]|uniref:Oxidoreductase n=1 Tax=Microlunatus endophyticus TaxID=1716077 RepID=A0A917W825_9ACTN|nr:SDR family NAD(P)-dependent oxidoreductase [Microlunatus endophyticus]GGL80856.1 oxidoreductase [Microlunatus endophyticus]
MDLSNDVILITGGTSGIGLEMAKQLAALGNTVIVTGRDEDRLSQFRQSHPGLSAYPVEVTDLASVETLYRQLVSDFPDLNVVINNAGLMQSIDFQSFAPAKVADEVAVNLAGPILVTQVFLPHLLKQSEAAVLNVTSGIAYFAFDKAPIYSASKLGLHSYTQTLRKQLAGTSVKVFELAPPRTTKPMFSGSEEDNRQVDRIPKMPIDQVVSTMISGIRRNRYEILPGMSKLLRLLGKARL